MQGPSGFFIQFIRLAGPYWHSENKAKIRSLTLALIALTLLQISLAIATNKWSAALFDALEQRSMTGLFKQIGLLTLILAGSILVTTTHLKVKRRLQIDWRNWLTERVTDQWMNKGRHYQVTHIQTPGHDNPDSRIAEDIRIATEEAIALSHSLFYSLMLLISFTTILWTLSGTVILNLGLVKIPIQGHLVWIAIMYAAGASFLGWWVSRPLIKATDARQTVEANFRFGLVKARENSQAIALIRGEAIEQRRFHSLFQTIVDTFDRQTHALANILMFTSGYSVLSMAFPILISAPRYILGTITLGALMQSALAFQQMASALSWPVDNMAGIAQWRASVERVLSLVKALEDLELEIATPSTDRISLEKSDQPVLAFHDLCIARHDGMVCAQDINDEIRPGERVLITGNTYSGFKLFKAIAGLWPWGHGRIELPDDEPMFFMPPLPYLPDGTLLDAICYPSSPETFSRDAIEAALKLAGLAEFIEQLEHTDNWEKVLSREEEQRLGFVRLLLYRPKWILLQEAFDSLDPAGEEMMLRMIGKQLPDAAILTVTNQPTADAFHKRRITL